MLAEQFLAGGPRLHLYDVVEKHWEDLMNWQHATMYLFFGLAGTVSLIVHTTEAAPLALDRLMLAIAFFNEGKKNDIFGGSLALVCLHDIYPAILLITTTCLDFIYKKLAISCCYQIQLLISYFSIPYR